LIIGTNVVTSTLVMAQPSNSQFVRFSAFMRCAMAVGLVLAMLLQTAKPLWVTKSAPTARMQYGALHASHWQAQGADEAGWASLEDWEEELEEDWGTDLQISSQRLRSIHGPSLFRSNQKRTNLVLGSLRRPLYELYCQRNIHLLSIA
jgi:hypothetical protein